MDVLKISDLSKSFGQKKVIKHLNLAVPENTIYGFIGQNVPRYEQKTLSIT